MTRGERPVPGIGPRARDGPGGRAAGALPARLRWVLERLDAREGHGLLEVGCGHGALLAAVLPRLGGARAVGLDASATAIARARERLADGLARGRVELVHARLADWRARARFDRVVAVDVNAFWLDPAPQLAAVARAIAADGVLLLAFRAPAAAQRDRAEAAACAGLSEAGFALRSVERDEVDGAPAVAIAATAPASRGTTPARRPA